MNRPGRHGTSNLAVATTVRILAFVTVACVAVEGYISVKTQTVTEGLKQALAGSLGAIVGLLAKVEGVTQTEIVNEPDKAVPTKDVK